ncbi:MAG: methyltransferase domain-containing protein [Verrucomicrobiae bacterium]|nr:methyltransferase domain-containing protein [Verrucomicrobiae bacterium]
MTPPTTAHSPPGSISPRETLLDFGNQPVSNRFLQNADDTPAPCFPFRLELSPDSGLVSLAATFPVNELKPRYGWLTNFEPEAHLDAMVLNISRLPGVQTDAVIGAYSFKDDTTLRRMEKQGFSRTWRIDPAQDLSVADPLANTETWQVAFTPDSARAIAARRGLADVFIVRHVLEHAYDFSGFVEACRACTRPDGHIIFEVPDCARALTLGDFTSLWEEHLFYFTPATLRWMLEREGFEIIHFHSHPYPFENSLIAFVRNTRTQGACSVDHPAVMAECDRARNFAARFADKKNNIRPLLEKARARHGSIALFGAGHLSVAFLSLYGVTDLVDFVADDNPHKKGMFMPVGRLPILGSEALLEKKTGLCLLSLNPQNQPKVIEKNAAFTQAGGRFASIFPATPLDLETVLS